MKLMGLYLLLMASETLGSFSVASSTSDQVVLPGRNFTLMCRVKSDGILNQDDWKFCRWTRLGDGANCLFEYKKVWTALFESHWTVEGGCDPQLDDADGKDRPKFFGSDPEVENVICGLAVRGATAEDSSDWKCLLEQCRITTGCNSANGNGVTASAVMNVRMIDG